MMLTFCGYPPPLLGWAVSCISNFRYWWLYGINFIIYLTTNQRIRKAYGRFLRDVWRFCCKKSKDAQQDGIEMNETSAWWIRMRESKSQLNTSIEATTKL